MLWTIFIISVCLLLVLDLSVFHRHAHVVRTKEALAWTIFWFSLSLAFSGIVYLAYEHGWVANPTELQPVDAVIKYLTGYLIEFSLSMDNIFVIAVIFNYFQIPQANQHRVLFWGILGAIIFRALMILLGVALINSFSWATYAFGALLLYSAYKMLSAGDEEVNLRKNPVVRFVRKMVPVTTEFHGQKFFVRRRHILAATPLFIALIVVETTDVFFAIDSIPAILAITADPFLVFSSNIFAILGLRSLYFVLSRMLEKFSLLKYSLVFILGYVGVKMILLHHVHIPEWISLAVIVIALGLGIMISLLRAPKTV